jgi:hypothetical protein
MLRPFRVWNVVVPVPPSADGNDSDRYSDACVLDRGAKREEETEEHEAAHTTDNTLSEKRRKVHMGQCYVGSWYSIHRNVQGSKLLNT